MAETTERNRNETREAKITTILKKGRINKGYIWKNIPEKTMIDFAKTLAECDEFDATEEKGEKVTSAIKQWRQIIDPTIMTIAEMTGVIGRIASEKGTNAEAIKAEILQAEITNQAQAVKALFEKIRQYAKSPIHEAIEQTSYAVESIIKNNVLLPSIEKMLEDANKIALKDKDIAKLENLVLGNIKQLSELVKRFAIIDAAIVEANQEAIKIALKPLVNELLNKDEIAQIFRPLITQGYRKRLTALQMEEQEQELEEKDVDLKEKGTKLAERKAKIEERRKQIQLLKDAIKANEEGKESPQGSQS